MKNSETLECFQIVRNLAFNFTPLKYYYWSLPMGAYIFLIQLKLVYQQYTNRLLKLFKKLV